MNEIRDLLPPDSLAIVLESYELAIQYSFIFCVVVTLCALLSSLFIQQFHLLSKKSNL
jgi:hypothetical protein